MPQRPATSDQRPDTGAVIVAAGRSRRMDGIDKLWAPLTGPDGGRRPLLAYSLATFQACTAVHRIALVASDETLERAQALVRDEGFDNVCAVVPGGASRQDSVLAGLDALGACTWVAIHDAARPLVTIDHIEQGLTEARGTGAACCALPVPDTVKESDDSGRIVRTLERSRMWLAQTPQVFRYDLLLKAHRQAEGFGLSLSPKAEATDDAALVEALGVTVRLYPGSPRNLKVTTKEDLALVEALLAQPS